MKVVTDREMWSKARERRIRGERSGGFRAKMEKIEEKESSPGRNEKKGGREYEERGEPRKMERRYGYDREMGREYERDHDLKRERSSGYEREYTGQRYGRERRGWNTEEQSGAQGYGEERSDYERDRGGGYKRERRYEDVRERSPDG